MKDEPTTIICAAEQVAMDGVPEEIKILPLGMVHNVHQDFWWMTKAAGLS